MNDISQRAGLDDADPCGLQIREPAGRMHDQAGTPFPSLPRSKGNAHRETGLPLQIPQDPAPSGEVSNFLPCAYALSCFSRVRAGAGAFSDEEQTLP